MHPSINLRISDRTVFFALTILFFGSLFFEPEAFIASLCSLSAGGFALVRILPDWKPEWQLIRGDGDAFKKLIPIYKLGFVIASALITGIVFLFVVVFFFKKPTPNQAGQPS